MPTNKIQTGLRLQEATYGKLRTLAIQENCSLNNLIEYVLQQYLNVYEAEHGSLPVFSEDEQT